jgi:hypothetical protein
MATSFTPGLRVAPNTVIIKERKLPLQGDVSVKPGDRVSFNQIVARTDLPGDIYPVQVAHSLGVEPSELKDLMLKNEKDTIKQGEVLALSSSFFGMFKNECESPIDGHVESISLRTGQVILQRPPVPVEVNAFMDGEIIDVHENEGVTVRTQGAYIQGIFGVGGEAWGALEIVSKEPNKVLDEQDLHEGLKGKIVVGGSCITLKALYKARDLGVSAVIVGGFDKGDLKEILGFELGVAITGNEDIGISLILTEGYGEIPMTHRTWDLLSKLAGKHASVNGATQIRAGVIRPEIVVPLPDATLEDENLHSGELNIGSEVRIIRQPWFGRRGSVTALPPALTKVESGAMVRVLEVKLEGLSETDAEETVLLPRANIELIER